MYNDDYGYIQEERQMTDSKIPIPLIRVPCTVESPHECSFQDVQYAKAACSMDIDKRLVMISIQTT
jgi:hypothetical protein